MKTWEEAMKSMARAEKLMIMTVAEEIVELLEDKNLQLNSSLNNTPYSIAQALIEKGSNEYAAEDWVEDCIRDFPEYFEKLEEEK